MKVVYAFALFVIFAFVLYGWGLALRRFLKAQIRSWPSTAASGMAALVFLGGVLNLARLAYPWALALVAIAGAALGIWAIASGERPRFSLVSLIPATLVLGFAVLTQVPPRAYNFHDDYQKYFVHPVRMLETGTVVGSTLNDIGFDTIGGQAFLDGFVVAFFPIRYINAMGAAFALFLCMLLASEFTRGRRDLTLMTLVCVLSVVYINPQYVNISALYTGSLLMMAVVEEEGQSPAVTGILHAALLALKSTFALFVVLHLAATLFIRGIKWTSRTALACALFFLPWFLLHAPHYAAIFQPNPSAPETGVRWQETFDMFSAEALDYGSTPRNYTVLMLAIGVSGLLIVWSRRRADMTAASCFAFLASYFVMIYVSGPRNAGYSQAVRYFAPFAIAAAPAAFGSAGVAFFDAAKPRSEWLRLGIPLLIASIPVLAFSPSLRDRAKQALDSGSVLAFSWLAPTPEYLDYNRQVLYGDMRQRVATAQSAIPADQAAVAWINAPFYLDFKRNPISDVEPGAGLIAPWSKMPDAHYFIYEYAGYATVDPDEYREEIAEGPDMMRRVGAARLNMTEKLSALMQRGQKLYDDGQIAVFRE
ncbi:MAG TPA: hypothetical protein VGG72_30470 [Bryobacteraceae bacterium]|jgi:hypothetical protein